MFLSLIYIYYRIPRDQGQAARLELAIRIIPFRTFFLLMLNAVFVFHYAA